MPMVIICIVVFHIFTQISQFCIPDELHVYNLIKIQINMTIKRMFTVEFLVFGLGSDHAFESTGSGASEVTN